MKKTSTQTISKKKKGRINRAKIKRIKKLMLFVLVVVAIIIFARSSFFIVDKINVSGNKKYLTDDVIKQTGLVTGKNVFKMLGEKPKNLLSFSFRNKEQSIYEAMPYVKKVSIRPSLPDSINIKIEERTPFAILENNGTSILIDREGYALEDVKTPELKNKYFKIIGISVDSYKLGQDVKFKSRFPLDDITSLCDELAKNDKDSKLKLFDKMKSINVSSVNSIVVVFDNRITVKFGDLENIEYKLRFFRQLFVNNINKKQKGTLDFTSSDNPYFSPE
jgi:cell division protein FtsQ